MSVSVFTIVLTPVQNSPYRSMYATTQVSEQSNCVVQDIQSRKTDRQMFCLSPATNSYAISSKKALSSIAGDP